MRKQQQLYAGSPLPVIGGTKKNPANPTAKHKWLEDLSYFKKEFLLPTSAFSENHLYRNTFTQEWIINGSN